MMMISHYKKLLLLLWFQDERYWWVEITTTKKVIITTKEIVLLALALVILIKFNFVIALNNICNIIDDGLMEWDEWSSSIHSICPSINRFCFVLVEYWTPSGNWMAWIQLNLANFQKIFLPRSTSLSHPFGDQFYSMEHNLCHLIEPNSTETLWSH